MLQSAIPVLHVGSSLAAEEYYCAKLGFKLIFATRADESRPDPCYMGIVRDGAILHLSSFAGDAVPGGVAFIVVDDVDRLFAEFEAGNIRIDLQPTQQTWGNREMYVKDPWRNCLRFVNDSQL